MKFERTRVAGFENALHGMRNPLASWKRSDSLFGLSLYDNMPEYEVAFKWVESMNPGLDHETGSFEDLQNDYAEWLRDGILRFDTDSEVTEYAFIGPNDMDLAMRLCNAGPEHRKFLRQIQVSVDITAPLYWQTFCQKTLYPFIKGVVRWPLIRSDLATAAANGEA